MSSSASPPQPAPSAAEITSASPTVGWAWTQTSLGPDVQGWAPGGPAIPTGTANAILTTDGDQNVIIPTNGPTIDPTTGITYFKVGTLRLSQNTSGFAEIDYYNNIGNRRFYAALFPDDSYRMQTDSAVGVVITSAGVCETDSRLTVNGAADDGVTAFLVNGGGKLNKAITSGVTTAGTITGFVTVDPTAGNSYFGTIAPSAGITLFIGGAIDGQSLTIVISNSGGSLSLEAGQFILDAAGVMAAQLAAFTSGVILIDTIYDSGVSACRVKTIVTYSS